ncbi:MAG: hypothetical protein B7Z15_16590 [Rhizobiales bacterium 32-66-8]|nr:MAG: hypothetical protein B7Z15_16590 [Rhizobiales bacterium 32-66-8]
MTRFTDRDGISLAYDVAGSGAPVLLIGGLSADRIFWGLCRPFLADFTTLCFDNRDMTPSGSATGPYTVADMARDALAVMDAAGIARALRTAVAIDPAAAGEIPSTKGALGV